MIYFYGGSFFKDMAVSNYIVLNIVEQEKYNSSYFNYRLGALGYLDWSYFNQHLNYNNGISSN